MACPCVNLRVIARRFYNNRRLRAQRDGP